jgi:hypothetical protein
LLHAAGCFFVPAKKGVTAKKERKAPWEVGTQATPTATRPLDNSQFLDGQLCCVPCTGQQPLTHARTHAPTNQPHKLIAPIGHIILNCRVLFSVGLVSPFLASKICTYTIITVDSISEDINKQAANTTARYISYLNSLTVGPRERTAPRGSEDEFQMALSAGRLKDDAQVMRAFVRCFLFLFSFLSRFLVVGC